MVYGPATNAIQRMLQQLFGQSESRDPLEAAANSIIGQDAQGLENEKMRMGVNPMPDFGLGLQGAQNTISSMLKPLANAMPMSSSDVTDGWANTIKDHSAAVGNDQLPQLMPNMGNGGGSMLDQLFNQLVNSVGGGAGMQSDYEDVLKDQEASIRAAYGGQIGAIQGQNRRTRREAGRNDQELEQMYEALARSNERSSNREEKATKRDVKRLGRIGEQGRNVIENSADRRQQSQADMLAGLGIGDAAPGILTDQNDALTKDLSRMEENTRQDQSFANRWGASDRRYLDRQATGARLEGTNRRADLQSQLTDILAGNRDQITGLRGEQGVALSNAASSLTGQMAEAQQSAASDQFNQLMQLAQLKMQMEGQASDQNMAAQQLLMDQQNAQGGGQDSSQYLPENYQNATNYILSSIPPQYQAKAMEGLKTLQGYPSMTTGYHYMQRDNMDAEKVKTTPEYAAQAIANWARQQGLPESVVQAMMNAANTYAS